MPCNAPLFILLNSFDHFYPLWHYMYTLSCQTKPYNKHMIFFVGVINRKRFKKSNKLPNIVVWSSYLLPFFCTIMKHVRSGEYVSLIKVLELPRQIKTKSWWLTNKMSTLVQRSSFVAMIREIVQLRGYDWSTHEYCCIAHRWPIFKSI